MQKINISNKGVIVEFTRTELTAIKNALHETLRELGMEEFHTRVGVSFEEGHAILRQYQDCLRQMESPGGADIT